MLAEDLIALFEAGREARPLTETHPGLTPEQGYEAAGALHRHRVARGWKPLGRKIGFTNRTIWPEYGVSAPIWGHVYDTTVHEAPRRDARLGIGHLLQPRIEPEIQLHFARTPPLTRDEAAILDCIDWIALGFEIVQSLFPGWRFRAVDTIAAFALHGALVVGPPVAVPDVEDCAAKLRSFTVILSRNGAQQATGGGANVLDTPLLAFAHLAEVLAKQSRFAPVQAGEIVTTGTLTKPLPVAPGQTWTTTVDGINLPGLSTALV